VAKAELIAVVPHSTAQSIRAIVRRRSGAPTEWLSQRSLEGSDLASDMDGNAAGHSEFHATIRRGPIASYPLHATASTATAAITSPVARIFPGVARRVRSVGRLSLARRHLGASSESQQDDQQGEPSMQVHCAEIGSIRLGSLFLTLPASAPTNE